MPLTTSKTYKCPTALGTVVGESASFTAHGSPSEAWRLPAGTTITARPFAEALTFYSTPRERTAGGPRATLLAQTRSEL